MFLKHCSYADTSHDHYMMMMMMMMMMSAQLCGHLKEPRILKKKKNLILSRSRRKIVSQMDGEVDLQRRSFSQRRAVNSACLWASFSIHAISSGSSSSGRERGCQIRRLCGMGICISLCARYYTSQLQGTMPLFPLYERHADVSRYHCIVVK